MHVTYLFEEKWDYVMLLYFPLFHLTHLPLKAIDLAAFDTLTFKRLST